MITTDDGCRNGRRFRMAGRRAVCPAGLARDRRFCAGAGAAGLRAEPAAVALPPGWRGTGGRWQRPDRGGRRRSRAAGCPGRRCCRPRSLAAVSGLRLGQVEAAAGHLGQPGGFLEGVADMDTAMGWFRSDTFKEATRLAKVTSRRFYLAQPQA